MPTNIAFILLNDWDPIGIKETDCPRDEYDAYVAPLAKMLSGNASEDAIVRYLAGIESQDMGLLPNVVRACKVARKLIALIQ